MSTSSRPALVRWLGLVLAAVTAAGVVLFGSGTASLVTESIAQAAVGAHASGTDAVFGLDAGVGAGQWLGSGPSPYHLASPGSGCTSNTAVIDGAGHTQTLGYNPSGQLTTSTDGYQKVTTHAFIHGDLTSVTDPLGGVQRIFYDGAGRVLSQTDPLGATSTAVYDPAGHVTSATDPLGNKTSYGFDANGNLHTLTDARTNVTTYNYDLSNRLTQQIDALTASDTYTYDLNDRTATHTDRRASKTTFTYDALGRTTLRGFGTTAGPTYTSKVTPGYDTGNRLTSLVDTRDGTATYGYDDLNNLTSVTNPRGAIAYGYDTANRRTSLTVTGQPAVTYGYFNNNQLQSVTQSANTANLTYDNDARPLTRAMPGGVTQTNTYDDASQLSAITNTNGATNLGAISYGHDLAGRVTQVGGTSAPVTLPATAGPNTYNADNELTKINHTNQTYDTNGNLTADGTNTYTWNDRNQLATVHFGTTTVTYGYDATGRRARTTNGTATDYLYDGTNIVAEKVGATTTATQLSAGNNEVFTRTTGAGTSNLLTDNAGSTTALTNTAGTKTTQYAYTPYGAPTVTGTTTPTTPTYTGQGYDPATGLQYNNARYYNPKIGRFISQDPIGTGGGTNLYAYANNSPTNFIDPNGTLAMGLVIVAALILTAVVCVLDPELIVGTLAIFDSSIIESLALADGFAAAGGAAVESAGVRFGVELTEKGLEHVFERHVVGAALQPGKSFFYDSAEVTGLIANADGVAPIAQASGNLAWIVDAGRIIGFDRAVGAATSIYTVITAAGGKLITAFPGIP